MIFKTLGSTGIGSALGLGLDQLGTLVVCYTIFNLPFAIWLMHSFFQTFRRRSRTRRGSTDIVRWQVLRKVVLPLAAPGLRSRRSLHSLLVERFLFASILTRSDAKTITMGLAILDPARRLWGPTVGRCPSCVSSR